MNIETEANELIQLLNNCNDRQYVDYVVKCVSDGEFVSRDTYLHEECIQDILDCIKHGQEG